MTHVHSNGGKLLYHVNKLQSKVGRNSLLNTAGRVYKLTSSTQDECYLELKSVNDQ
jgi:hypothetical protein